MGQDIISLLLFPRRYGCACFEAEALVSGLQDVAAVGETVEERGRHLGVPKDGGPFAEAQVRGDDNAGGYLNQTGFTGEHKAWKVSHDKRKFREPFFDRSAGARSAFGA